MFKINIWERSSEDAVCSANITQFSNRQTNSVSLSPFKYLTWVIFWKMCAHLVLQQSNLNFFHSNPEILCVKGIHRAFIKGVIDITWIATAVTLVETSATKFFWFGSDISTGCPSNSIFAKIVPWCQKNKKIKSKWTTGNEKSIWSICDLVKKKTDETLRYLDSKFKTRTK